MPGVLTLPAETHRAYRVCVCVCVCVVGCWGFMSLQHLRSYQDVYRLVTVRGYSDFLVLCTGDFIVLPCWVLFVCNLTS